MASFPTPLAAGALLVAGVWKETLGSLGCWSAHLPVGAAARWSVGGRSGSMATMAGFTWRSVGARAGRTGFVTAAGR